MARFLLATVICLVVSAAAAETANPWVAMSLGDLQSIHDTLRDSHPAMVDPAPSGAPYRRWLEDGLVQARARALAARSFEDYQRALQFYTNGFRDGHIAVRMYAATDMQSWTGFVVGGWALDDVRVVSAQPDSGVAVGDRLISCDGKSVDALLADRTDPFFWNRDIPQSRVAQLYRLFVQDRGDPRPKPASCAFSSGTVKLVWRDGRAADVQAVIDAARGRGSRELRAQKIAGVWLISIPTFSYFTNDDIAKAHAFVDMLKQRAAEFRGSTVVLDVHGNGGGDSNWGDEMAAALWGQAWVDRIEGQFDGTVDWRASPENIAGLEAGLKREQASGQTDAVAYATMTLSGMKAALARGDDYFRVEDRPKPQTESVPANPLTGRVYLFTDPGCGSACLDFVDLVRRLPGVTQVGLPTFADAIYIDNTSHDLPSGLGYLSYSLKVYRNRVRGNNEWYEPQIRWPGGTMTDDAIAHWVATLR